MKRAKKQNTRNKYADYERDKAKIEKGLTGDEYLQQIKKIARKHGI